MPNDQPQRGPEPPDPAAALRRQHIATKNAAAAIFKGQYDYGERVTVGEVVRAIEALRFEDLRVDESR